MIHTILINSLISLSIAGFAVSQDRVPQPATSTSQTVLSGETGDGKIYKESAVDVKAKSTIADMKLKNFEDAVASCHSGKQQLVRVRLVLSRLGKVTDVKVLKDEPKCGLADALIKDVRAMTFVPAIKDGRAVSVYRDLQIKASGRKNIDTKRNLPATQKFME